VIQLNATAIAASGELRDDPMSVFRCTIMAIFVTTLGVAHADPAKLFEEGRALVEKKDFKRGCAKFREAYKETKDGDSTRPTIEANLGLCAERDEDLPKAWRYFMSAAATWERERDDRAAQVKTQADDVAKRATVVVIGVPDPALPGLAIEVNGEPVEPKPTVRALAMPGEIRIGATATGKKPFARVEKRRAGETLVVELVLEEKVDDVAPVPRAITRRRRGFVYGSIGLGVASIGALVGAYFRRRVLLSRRRAV
jgi:hypothetical protein